jgi:hypothetical protein
LLVDVLERLAQLADQAVLVLVGLGDRQQLALDLAQVGDRDGVVGDDDAAALGEHRRVARVDLGAGLGDLEDDLRGVLLERVVGGRRVGGAEPS